ncbi:hypothetical protein BDV93DRAFT_551995 [Ceratobasidium sp. AG-I]|nr:hypothetical protein BDV93DRAFT_551995 [Ceratobasidium sp. AG-I]
MATQALSNCPLAAQRHFRPICPSLAARKKGQRCINAGRIGNNSRDQELHPAVQVHQRPTGANYFTHMKFLTPNDLVHPNAHSAFMRAAQHIELCLGAHGLGHDEYEVVIVLNCVSHQALKFYYYIVDHEQRTIRWIHPNTTPSEVALSVSPAMRNSAEYWTHRNRFPAHKLCTQADRDALVAQLNSLHQTNGVMPTGDIQTYLQDLNNFSANLRVTCRITEIYLEFYKSSLPGFRGVGSTSKLKKTLYGFLKAPGRLLHAAVHSDTPIQSPESTPQSSRSSNESA